MTIYARSEVPKGREIKSLNFKRIAGTSEQISQDPRKGNWFATEVEKFVDEIPPFETIDELVW